jgi:hypothetical protein
LQFYCFLYVFLYISRAAFLEHLFNPVIIIQLDLNFLYFLDSLIHYFIKVEVEVPAGAGEFVEVLDVLVDQVVDEEVRI